MAHDESQLRKIGHPRGTERGKDSSFCYADGRICHHRNSELEQKFQTYKGRVVLWGDMVKDDSDSCAAFTEQGSSAPQMIAAKVMDTIARLPWCAGQAADAVSACTHVKMEDPPALLKLPKSECPDIWVRRPRHKSPLSWSNIEEPMIPL